MPRFVAPGLVSALALALAACASPAAPTREPATSPGAIATPMPTDATPTGMPTAVLPGAISIKEFEFMPPTVTVRAGDAVVWTNEEDSLHTVTAGTPEARTGMFDSGEFDTGETFEHTFPEAGSYPFFCDRHEFMRGVVTVTP